MSFRFSIGCRWFEVHVMDRVFNGWLYLIIKYGHNSTRNLITWQTIDSGKTVLKIGKRRAKYVSLGKTKEL